MTTRDKLNRVRRRVALLAPVGFIMFAAGGAASQTHQAFIAVAVLGFALFAMSIVYPMVTGRCVHCDRLLGLIFSQAGSSFLRIAPNLQFCPYCGKSLDDEPA